MRTWKLKFRRYILLVGVVIFIWACLHLFHEQAGIFLPSHTEDNDEAVRLEFLKRRQRPYDACVNDEKGVVQNVLIYKPKNMVYCPVAKVGSTFWKQTLLFLHNDTGNASVSTPFEIKRMFVHYGKHHSIKNVPVNSRHAFWNMTRFMFVRDPYSRLWSSYLDKFFLPDFWKSEAVHVVKKRGTKQSKRTAKCNHDITFAEFLSYVVWRKGKPSAMNEHWRPIPYMCNPCEFRPHFVGKQETFKQDAQYILKQLGLDHILSSYDHKTHVEEELKMLITYNYKRNSKQDITGCLSDHELAERLWTVFEFNGYLPLGSKSVLDGVSNLTENALIDLALNTYRTKPMSSSDLKKQRQNALISAYKSVSSDVIKGLQELFRMDFIHFDYDPNPPSSEPVNPPISEPVNPSSSGSV